MKKYNILLLTHLIFLVCLIACGKEETVILPSDASSYDLIQSQILTTRCGTPGCHASDKDGLVLTKDVSYDRMVNVVPTNANAKKDGLKLVTPFNADKSLLFHKIHDDAGHHSSDYGKIMPLGGTVLKDGEIEFIKRWINAGAPKTGDIVDRNLLK
jgi:hypothetical protein